MEYQPLISDDKIHCGGNCPFLQITPFGPDEYSLEARCTLLNRELMYHDFWIAECDD